MTEAAIFAGGGGENYGTPEELLLKFGNRHGLIAGATGTGKTVTLQVLAEGFSAAGVPVFLSDIKGDLSGICQSGSPEAKTHVAFSQRAQTIGLDLQYRSFPVIFWDLFGEKGHPVRATVAEMGPLLLSRLLELSEAQEGALNVAFRLADDEGLALLDMKDLQALLTYVAQNTEAVTARYGLVSATSLGAIQRRLLVLENEGGAKLFGEPALALSDLMLCDEKGEGRISILASDRLINSPRLYATFLLWLLSELFETLPEVGDPDRPKLVFFFDEAHLLFNDAPKALVSKVEQVARLIRSKGVGVYFFTQNPADVPDTILGQLGNRVQHGLRAFTARDQKGLKQAAETYRPNPRFDIAEAIRDLGTGEAVTSFLELKGVPGMAERTLIRPPSSRLGPAEEWAIASARGKSPVDGKYDQPIDRESAWEILRDRAEKAAAEAERSQSGTVTTTEEAAPTEFNRGRRYGGEASRNASKPKTTTTRSSRSDSVTETFAKSFARQLGTKSGQAVVRGVLGTLFGKR